MNARLWVTLPAEAVPGLLEGREPCPDTLLMQLLYLENTELHPHQSSSFPNVPGYHIRSDCPSDTTLTREAPRGVF